MHADNIEGLELLDLNWLLDHHEAKAAHRQQVVNALNLNPGEVVIDLGCGPGLWSRMLAEKVAPTGKVIGIDYDERYLNYAQRQLKDEPLAECIEYRHGDFVQMTIADKGNDFIFSSGCSPYIKDIEAFLLKQKQLVKPGGRVADRSWDDSLFLFHPIDLDLSTKLIAAVAKAAQNRPAHAYFDNYFGRKSNGLFKQLGFQEVTTQAFGVQQTAPLSDATKRYISGNAEWYAKVATPYLSEAERTQWLACFDANSAQYVLDRPDFYYCMLEILTIGTV